MYQKGKKIYCIYPSMVIDERKANRKLLHTKTEWQAHIPVCM